MAARKFYPELGTTGKPLRINARDIESLVAGNIELDQHARLCAESLVDCRQTVDHAGNPTAERTALGAVEGRAAYRASREGGDHAAEIGESLAQANRRSARSHSTGAEKRSGAVLRLLSRTASGAEHRLQPQPFRNRGLPARRTARLTPLNASSRRFFLCWAATNHTPRPQKLNAPSHRFFLFCPATNHTPHATQMLYASSHRFFLFWAERTVDSVRPVARSVDRPWGQRRAVRIILGPRNAEAAPPPVLGAPHQVGPQGVPLDIAAHREEMLVRLHGERLEPTLIEMTGAGRSVVRIATAGCASW